ncbi:MAG: GxxExxY protein [Anaerolineae bacterium]
MEINLLAEAIIGSAIEVHRPLGPGLLESAYPNFVQLCDLMSWWLEKAPA